MSSPFGLGFLVVNSSCSLKGEAMHRSQYAPVVKGVTLWDMYPTFQGTANYQKREWTHVKLVIGKHQMRVYVNETEQPNRSQRAVRS
jgi:hypothetical protein